MTRDGAPTTPGARWELVRFERLTKLAALAAFALAAAGCAGHAGNVASPLEATTPRDDLRRLEGRPPLVVIARAGDPRGAIAVAVSTEGIAPERGAAVATALAAIIEARVSGVTVTPSRLGIRIGALVSSDAEATSMTAALATAFLAPVTDGDLLAVTRKLAMLARRPLADAALEPASECAGDAVGPAGAHGEPDPVTRDLVEAWRRAAVGVGRAAFATVGASTLADAVAQALAHGAAWPTAELAPPGTGLPTEASVYDATGSDVPAGGARATLSVRTSSASRAVRAAEHLGDSRGALAARLGGLDAPARIHDVTATAHARGACVVVSIDFAARDLAIDAPTRIAAAVALARQEIATELTEVPAEPALGSAIARRAGDPRDAAQLAAWWALSHSDAEAADSEIRIATAIGVATGRDAPTMSDATNATRANAIRAELDRAVIAWHEPVVEGRTRVEAGQGDVWIAIGSPCGTMPESASDAGLGAAFVIAAADRANQALAESGAGAEAFASSDALGIVVHGPALPGESPEAHARRIADAAARSFAAEPVDRAAVSRARARLLDADEAADARALVTLGEAIAPGHGSWFAPMGPLDALGRSSDAAVAARASAVRAGPIRVAVLANTDEAQADVAARAVDRWIARRPGQARACPVESSPGAARPGTYVVDAANGGASQAWIALPLAGGAGTPPLDDASLRASADGIAAALDGGDGLLARALSGGLARSWSARTIGSSRAAALVVRVDSPGSALDASVAQVRALLDRLRQGSLSDADRTHAAQIAGDRDLAAGLDPSKRVLALWRGETAPPLPALEALRAFAAGAIKDDALVIVAVRPPRVDRPAKSP